MDRFRSFIAEREFVARRVWVVFGGFVRGQLLDQADGAVERLERDVGDDPWDFARDIARSRD